jgi:uncharacterized Fe-S cluster-containing radical SAM superfamily protein
VLLRAGLALLKGRAPGQLVIQFTDACNAQCPQCGMSVDNAFHRSKLEPQFVRRVLETAAGRGVMSVSITGGEPLLYSEQVLDLLAHARSLGIRYTRTGTNGFLFQRADASDFHRRVARLAVRLREARVYTFWISLDSADPTTHEQARGLPGVVDGIRRALPVFHDHGVYPTVNLGINRNMGKTPIEPLRDPDEFEKQAREALRDFYRAALDLGFTMANVCYPMGLGNDDPVAAYQATSSAELVQFSSEERVILFRVLAEVTRDFRSRIRIFTPLSSLSALSSQHSGSDKGIAPCRGGVDFFYISAAGRLLYPCGFRGMEPLGDPTDAATWATGARADCLLCDWECFRDPSHLIAPLTRMVRRPDQVLRWIITDSDLARAWWRDWRYYSACSYFSSGQRLHPERLSRRS